MNQVDHTPADLTASLSGAIGDSVMLFAATAAALVALFGDSESIERLGYCLAILVVTPLCVTIAWRRQRVHAADERLRLVAFATLASTTGALCLARILEPVIAGAVGTSLFLLLELVTARVAIALVGRSIPASWPRRLPPSTTIAATPLLLAIGAGAFIPTPTFRILDIAISLAAAVTAFHLVSTDRGQRLPRLPRLPRLSAHFVDFAILAICALVVFYLARPNRDLAFNHDFFLGPALEVLHGRTMLVNAISYYGVGIDYFLAAFFLIVPMGYGTLTLLISALTALLFAIFYTILRWSTRSILISTIGLTTAVILYMFGQIYFYTFFPSTGVLRFGPPWVVILCSLAAARTARHKRSFEMLVLITVAVAILWSAEAGIYCLATAGALACFGAALAGGSARQRVRQATRQLALLALVSLASLLAFTLVTGVLAGAAPDWGTYLEFLKMEAGSSALPIDPWSPGLAIGWLYTASTVAIVLLLLTRPSLVRERAIAFRAATGLTVFGALVYIYFLNRSHPNNVIHISPPAIALLFVWFDIARTMLNSRVAVAMASAATVFFSALVVSSERQNISQKYSSTALAAVLGTGEPLSARLHALADNPLVEPASAHVIAFIESLAVKRTSLTLVMGQNVTTEVLLRLNVANAVGATAPSQEELDPRQAIKRISGDLSSLQPGGIVVVNPREFIQPDVQYSYSLLQEHFTLQKIGADGQGLEAFRIVS